MLDALGFKGIWERSAPEAVFENMLAVREAVMRAAASATRALAKNLTGPGKLAEAPMATAQFLSDTIVIALHFRGFGAADNERTRAIVEAAMVAYTVHMTAFAIAGSAHTENAAPLNYRGAVTWGEFLLQDNFLVGPAVDQVAELHNRSDGAFVELTNSAALRFERASSAPFPPEIKPRRLALEFSIPIKADCRTGSVQRAERRWVVNPFATCSNAGEVHDVLDGMKRAFGTDGAQVHATKFLNTMTFVGEARRAWDSREPGIAG